MAEPFTIYKMTILYMLEKSAVPLTNTQITSFFLDQEYTDYFRVQEVLRDLADTGLITEEQTRQTTQYSLSPAGRESLEFFRAKLSDGIIQDVKDYYESHQWVFRQENSIFADYRRTKHYSYEVTCQVRSDGDPIIDLKLSVKTKEQAEALCRNWKLHQDEVYEAIMDILMQ